MSLPSSAHTVVLSEYTLLRENGQWVLSFFQKTSQLRDAIYASRPDLKGMNLNSDTFLKATEDHIVSNLSLKYKGKSLRMFPSSMHYGGLRFESTFAVRGLSDDPDYLTITASGFDAHEHSVVLFRISTGTEGYLNYFNQTQRLATFDFNTHHYVFEEISSEEHPDLFLYLGLLFIIAVGAVYFTRMRK